MAAAQQVSRREGVEKERGNTYSKAIQARRWMGRDGGRGRAQALTSLLL